ncbi:unnamed protein product [Symbiodinium sp. CCMP2456]|nr:unnamed protein product [Symbiodinium sp. CCMP2456]
MKAGLHMPCFPQPSAPSLHPSQRQQRPMSSKQRGHLTHRAVQLLALCVGIGALGLGLSCLVDPVTSAKMYGLPSDGSISALCWVKAVGVRDICLGIGTMAFLMLQPSALRIFAPTMLLVTGSDAALTIGGPSTADHLLGSVIVGLLSAAAWSDPFLAPAESHSYKHT